MVNSHHHLQENLQLGGANAETSQDKTGNLELGGANAETTQEKTGNLELGGTLKVRAPVSRLHRGRRTSRENGHPSKGWQRFFISRSQGVSRMHTGVNSKYHIFLFTGVNSRRQSREPGFRGAIPGVDSGLLLELTPGGLVLGATPGVASRGLAGDPGVSGMTRFM